MNKKEFYLKMGDDKRYRFNYINHNKMFMLAVVLFMIVVLSFCFVIADVPLNSYSNSDCSPLAEITTDEPADCRGSVNDESYDQMLNDIDCIGDGSLNHQCQFYDLSYSIDTLYFSCRDLFGNKNSALNNQEESVIIPDFCGSVCGNNFCESDEDEISCFSDCGEFCIDSDGGKNYYVKGTATDGDLAIVDSCLVGSSDVLVEGYCEDGNSLPQSEQYSCPNGCENGVCKGSGCSTDNDCIDSYSANYCLVGDVYRDHYDFSCQLGICANSQTVSELVQACEYGCENNACVTEPPTCTSDDDCTDYFSDPYCSAGDVYRYKRDFKCLVGVCTENSVNPLLLFECQEGCEDGSCLSGDEDNGEEGGVITQLQPIGGLVVTPEKLVVDSGVGETNKRNIKIINSGDGINVKLNVENLRDNILIKEDDLMFYLDSGRSAVKDIIFNAPEEAGTYTGKIKVNSKEVLVTLNVQEGEQMFYTDTVMFEKIFVSGEKLKFDVIILPFGDLEGANVRLIYKIKDFDGNVYFEESEELFVQGNERLSKEFDVTLEPGEYILTLAATPLDSGSTTVSSEDFKVIAEEKVSKKFLYIILAIIVIVLAFLLYYLLSRNKHKKEGHKGLHKERHKNKYKRKKKK